VKWLKSRKRAQAEAGERSNSNERREFIYLDEVSVTSLLSSRDGAIPKEFTHSEGANIKAEVNANVEAGISPFKAKLGSRYESARSSNSQVVSKATVQTLFKRLFDAEEKEGGLILRRSFSTTRDQTTADLKAFLDTNDSKVGSSDWGVAAEDLKRGQLAEIEVELETDEIFQLSTIMATLKDLSDENEELRAILSQSMVEEFTAANKVIEKMMVGLIPLKCRVVNYVVVDTSRGAQLVHKAAYDSIPSEDRPQAEPLYLVGDTQQDLYWKDIRRVLFTKSRFHVLCRLNNDGISTSWSPLKLANVLRHLDPYLGNKLAQFGSLAVNAFSAGGKVMTRLDERKTEAMETYGRLLAEEAGVILTQEDQVSLHIIAYEKHANFTSALKIKAAFTPVLEFVEAKTSTPFTPHTIAQLRAEACRAHGLAVDGTIVEPQSIAPSFEFNEASSRLVDVEIVAIYW
jgi:hypothetical protein